MSTQAQLRLQWSCLVVQQACRPAAASLMPSTPSYSHHRLTCEGKGLAWWSSRPAGRRRRRRCRARPRSRRRCSPRARAPSAPSPCRPPRTPGARRSGSAARTPLPMRMHGIALNMCQEPCSGLKIKISFLCKIMRDQAIETEKNGRRPCGAPTELVGGGLSQIQFTVSHCAML